jgi:hypothetical protein
MASWYTLYIEGTHPLKTLTDVLQSRLAKVAIAEHNRYIIFGEDVRIFPSHTPLMMRDIMQEVWGSAPPIKMTLYFDNAETREALREEILACLVDWMQRHTGDCIFAHQGEIVYFMRRQGALFINNAEVLPTLETLFSRVGWAYTLEALDAFSS